MNKRVNGIKGQTQISFGMIFSVILIILFIAFAVYGISKFLGVSKLAQVESFKRDFQIDIDKVWKGSGTSTPVEYFLPSKIKQVCFVDDDYRNMYFVPLDSGYNGILLKNVDMTKTVASLTSSSTSNPKKPCIPTLDGKISMTIKKAYNEILVTIAK